MNGVPRLRLGLAQIDPVVGDLDGNVERVLTDARRAESAGCDLVVFPELVITGYPPEDLLLRPGFVADAEQALDRVVAESGDMTIVVGSVRRGSGTGHEAVEGEHRIEAGPSDRLVLHNSVVACRRGVVVSEHHKRFLPNYSVFDEQRYFAPGEVTAPPFLLDGVRIGLAICEDIWRPDGPVVDLARAGIDALVVVNASPFDVGKAAMRASIVRERAMEIGVPVVYVNMVGGQDELVFDGDSMVVAGDGTVVARAPRFEEGLHVVDLELPATPAVTPVAEMGIAPALGEEEEVWSALVLGTRDFVRKNGFSEVVIGLSGGVDSALVAAIAVEALGAANVHGVLMPSRYSSEHSVSDALELARNLGIDHRTIPIEPAHLAFMEMLRPSIEGHPLGLTEENLQSRVRAVILMGLSNAFGWLLLNTGNKSESSVGYSTLYGDSAGAYAVIKDVSKLLVYRLCHWRNGRDGAVVIPVDILEKAPSAELRPDQRDDQSLPPYEVLDPILTAYVEQDRSGAEIVAMGHDPEVAAQVIRLVDASEYKRRQGPPGPRITTKAFGKDRRLPIVNRYRR